MDIGELDCVALKNDTPGTIVDVWELGVAYELEPVTIPSLPSGIS